MPSHRPTRRMTNMNVLETSGVDHPAHGYEGWIVRKSALPQDVTRLRSLMRKESTMPTLTKASIVAEIRSSKVEKSAQEALVKAIDLQPDVDAAAQLWQSLRSKLEADDPDVPTVTDPNNPAAAPVAPTSGAPVAPTPVTPAAPAAANPAVDPSQLFKSVTDPEIRSILIKQQADIESANAKTADALEKAAEERNLRLDREAVQKSKAEFKYLAVDHDKVAPAMRKMAEESPEQYEVVYESMTKANAQLEAAGMFAEIGSAQARNSGDSGSALAKATSLAEGFISAGVSKDMNSAMAKAWKDNPSLYTEYEKEGNR